MKIHLFVPCLVDQAVPETAHATISLLKRLGHTVVVPKNQTCCGQAVFNMGFWNEAKTLAEKFIHVFRDAEVVVAPSGSCASMVSHHYGELTLSDASARVWNELHSKVFELTTFLVDYLKLSDVGGRYPHKVGLHASCHALRDLGIKNQAVKLLQSVKELELVNIPTDECCGFGGAFSVKYSELSNSIAGRRTNAIAASGAEWITGVDDSCLHHLDESFKRLGMPQRTVHIARILAHE